MLYLSQVRVFEFAYSLTFFGKGWSCIVRKKMVVLAISFFSADILTTVKFRAAATEMTGIYFSKVQNRSFVKLIMHDLFFSLSFLSLSLSRHSSLTLVSPQLRLPAAGNRPSNSSFHRVHTHTE